LGGGSSPGTVSNLNKKIYGQISADRGHQFEVRSGRRRGPEHKRWRFTEEQIIGILKEHEAGVSVADLWQAWCQ
jgi:hypothetical protein